MTYLSADCGAGRPLGGYCALQGRDFLLVIGNPAAMAIQSLVDVCHLGTGIHVVSNSLL